MPVIKNILRATTVANSVINGSPSINLNQLENTTEGVIAILPPENNPFQSALAEDKTKNAELILSLYKKTFGENLYLGISPQDFTPRSQESTIDNQTESILQHAKKSDVRCIPTPLIYLLDNEDEETRQTLLKIQQTTLSEREEDVFRDQLILPKREHIEKWSDKESLKNLSDLLESIDVSLELGKWTFPDPLIGKNQDPDEVLERLVEEGLEKRKVEKTPEVRERISFELDTIKKRGYSGYFLIVIDLVQYMQSRGILTTTRGSSAGSMISYLTGVTSVNPITYKLPFERFLNPFRPSPPDIDLDIADDRRSEVIEYISERYGKEKVAQIGTLGKLLARAAVRDTARALGYSYITGDRIARLIPFGVQGFPMYIDRALKEVPELQKLYDTDTTVQHIINVSKKIEGNPRHNSVHAAGVVISPTTITDYTPLEQDKKATNQKMVTQYDMHNLEDVGLIKFDILGISYISILAHSVTFVREDKGVDIDVTDLPERQEVYKMIGEGHTTGIFQLSGSGMTAVLKKMKPTTLYDIAAVIALYRPGPMKNIDEYIERKQGKRKTSFFHPKMEKFLAQSYGVLVYQDDLLYTAIELAGYNWKEVDVFRKAVGKKIPELMAKQEKVFKKRVAENTDLSTSAINDIWKLFDPFKGYGFNKAHAISYATLSYQTAYMKCFYPVQYMTAHLRAMSGDIENITNSIYEARRMGIKILPPDINKSDIQFSTEKDNDGNEAIRVGLNTIKQVGMVVAEKIINEREKNGQFTSVIDFLSRVTDIQEIHKRTLEGLIKVGAFDYMEKRNVLLENLNLLIQSIKEMGANSTQGSLFDRSPTLSLQLKPATSKISHNQELFWERELMGMYASGHPLLYISNTDALTVADLKKKNVGARVRLIGVIGAINYIRTKKGERMCFLKIEDSKNNTIEACCFSDVIEKYEEYLGLYRTIYIKGVVKERNGEKFFLVEEVEDLKTTDIQQEHQK